MRRSRLLDLLNTYKNKNAHVFLDPVSAKLDDYKNACDEYLNAISKHPDVLSVYQLGEVSVPGLSDLDILVITKDDLETSNTRSFSRKILSSKISQYVMMHNAFFVPSRLTRDFEILFPAFDNLRLLFGKEMLNKLSDKDRAVALCILSDVIIESYPVEFLVFFVSKIIPVRLALARLNALKHAISLYVTAGGSCDPEWRKLLDIIQEMRENFFKRPSQYYHSQLLEVLYKAIHVSTDLAWSVQSMLKEKWSYRLPKNTFGWYSADTFDVLFIPKNREEVLETMLSIYSDYDITVNCLPQEFALVMAVYAKVSGSRSTFIQQNLRLTTQNPFDRPEVEVDLTFIKRAVTMDAYLEYISENKLCFSYFNGLGYHPTCGFISTLRNKFRIAKSYKRYLWRFKYSHEFKKMEA